jgi:hypothetical protein
MSPAFLHGEVAPILNDTTQDLLDLWREKVRLVGARPFRANQDIIRSVVDMILLATLGTSSDLSREQTRMLSALKDIQVHADPDLRVVFPVAQESPTYSSVRTVVDSIAIGMSSPIPRMHMTFALRFYPSLARAKRFTDRLMSDVLEGAWEKFHTRDIRHDKGRVTAAIDLIVRREVQLAEKQDRAVMLDYPATRDELMGFTSLVTKPHLRRSAGLSSI